VIAVEGPGTGEQPPEFLGAVGPSLGVAESGVGVDWRWWGWDFADGVGVDASVVLGCLEDAVEHRPTGHHRVVTDRGPQFVLPAADHADRDRTELVQAEEGQQVAA
jgi:hypothetical protein